jgi:sigma-E processing peptidase SpoIIGA
MKTLYIDVYFLINFTVDIISVYFAGVLAGIKPNAKRLIVCGLVGALNACIVVLANIKGVLFIVALLLTSFLMAVFSYKKASFLLRFKIMLAFTVIETLIGGFVSSSFYILDKYLAPKLSESELGAQNRSFLILALMILVAYFSIRLILPVFENRRCEKSVKLYGSFGKENFEISCLVDSGNMLRDPMENIPVVVVKKRVLIGIYNLIEGAIGSDDFEIKKRIRIIPTSSLGGDRVLMGIRLENVKIDNHSVKECIIAFDDSGSSFCGYDALVPSAILGG